MQVDKERLLQALSNVVTNAWQSMVQGDGSKPLSGAITVSTERERDRLMIRVGDSGPGIPPEVMERMFEPLYSTKGFGVGLGLPLVKRNMEQLGGGMSVRTELGAGTAMTLWLPLR